MTQRTIPASDAIGLPPGVDAADVIWDETVGPGDYASHELPAGAVLRLADLDGDACVHLLVFNAARPSERLNVADTVKVQWQAYLGPEAVLLSDMGRVLMTIVADTSARHDALCGSASSTVIGARYGASGIHTATPSARDLLTVAAAKHGLDRSRPADRRQPVQVGDRRRRRVAAPATAIRDRARRSSCAPSST